MFILVVDFSFLSLYLFYFVWILNLVYYFQIKKKHFCDFIYLLKMGCQ